VLIQEALPIRRCERVQHIANILKAVRRNAFHTAVRGKETLKKLVDAHLVLTEFAQARVNIEPQQDTFRVVILSALPVAPCNCAFGHVENVECAVGKRVQLAATTGGGQCGVLYGLRVLAANGDRKPT
jgi:hypothetical protein